MNIPAKFLQHWVAWVLPRPRLILGLTPITVIASIWIASVRLDVQTDQLELISTSHPLIELSDRLDPFNFNGKATQSLLSTAS
jgi:hypothetical protein